MDRTRIEQAAALLRDKQRIVALTGAGCSKPSGIPDFRSAGGLWEQDDPMEVASIMTLRTRPERFFGWLRGLMETMLPAKPNPAHQALVMLEQQGALSAIVTQNIDSLHHLAGSQTVYELHGHARTCTCMITGKQVPVDDDIIKTIQSGEVPKSAAGGILKPDIVLFGEMLPEDAFVGAQHALLACDAVIVAGTSLEVQPAAGLPLIAVQRGVPLIMINFEQTYLDSRADVVIHDDVAAVLPAIVEERTR